MPAFSSQLIFRFVQFLMFTVFIDVPYIVAIELLCDIYIWFDIKVRELITVKFATYLIAEYHCGRLQSHLGKLCTDASA
jgi:hypothetical protein